MCDSQCESGERQCGGIGFKQSLHVPLTIKLVYAAGYLEWSLLGVIMNSRVCFPVDLPVDCVSSVCAYSVCVFQLTYLLTEVCITTVHRNAEIFWKQKLCRVSDVCGGIENRSRLITSYESAAGAEVLADDDQLQIESKN